MKPQQGASVRGRIIEKNLREAEYQGLWSQGGAAVQSEESKHLGHQSKNIKWKLSPHLKIQKT